MLKSVTLFLKRIFSLYGTTDALGTIESIRNSATIRGYNGWLLVASSMLACIGLDQNSAAVIIGAMLISPLMSPILGLGLAVGINDRDLLISALRNFFIAMGASLLVSTVYFLLTPLGDPTEQIIARTRPTTLDVLVAFFGGVAGVVAGSRKDKTNAIPGVAIATALMPPLCVAGYGIAKFDMEIFFGAFYLFFLNSVFIALATFLIVRYLGFPYVSYPDNETRRKAVRYISVFSFLLVLPSGVVMYALLKEIRTEQHVNQFLDSEFSKGSRKIIDYELTLTDSVNYLKLFMTGRFLPIDSVAILEAKSTEYRLKNIHLECIQDLPPLDGNNLANQTKLTVIKELQPLMEAQNQKLDSLRALLEVKRQDKSTTQTLQKEGRVVFPELEDILLSFEAVEVLSTGKADTLAVVIPTWKKGMSATNLRKLDLKMLAWVKTRFELDSVVVAHR